MQERYLGDSHDFLKYALLRKLKQSLGLKLGINWYLTRPEEVDRPDNNDGEKRHHLTAPHWALIDHELFNVIRQFELPSSRRLKHVGEWGLLPNDTVYFDEAVPASDRDGWLRRSMETLAPASLVFMDPDNGFEVASMTRKTRPKYSLFEEAAAYANNNQAVVGIQFARQCDPIKRAAGIRDRLVEQHGERAMLPVIRGRVAPNILFFTIAPAARLADFDHAIRGFAAHCGATSDGATSSAKVQLIV